MKEVRVHKEGTSRCCSDGRHLPPCIRWFISTKSFRFLLGSSPIWLRLSLPWWLLAWCSEMTSDMKKTPNLCLFCFPCPEFVAISGWVQPKLQKAPQLQAVLWCCNYIRAWQSTKQIHSVCVYVRVCLSVCYGQLPVDGERSLVGYHCLLWVCSRRVLFFSKMVVKNGEIWGREEEVYGQRDSMVSGLRRNTKVKVNQGGWEWRLGAGVLVTAQKSGWKVGKVTGTEDNKEKLWDTED